MTKIHTVRRTTHLDSLFALGLKSVSCLGWALRPFAKTCNYLLKNLPAGPRVADKTKGERPLECLQSSTSELQSRSSFKSQAALDTSGPKRGISLRGISLCWLQRRRCWNAGCQLDIDQDTKFSAGWDKSFGNFKVSLLVITGSVKPNHPKPTNGVGQHEEMRVWMLLADKQE